MDRHLQLFPEQASVGAQQLDRLYLYLVVISFFFTFLICFLILFFVVRYRRGSGASRTEASTGHLGLEVAWSLIPLVLMMISFVWGAKLYVNYRQPPANSSNIFVVGKQWMWKIQHAEGRREINELHVPLGQPVRLTMISEDVIHSLFIPAFRVKQDVLPGRYTRMWFHPTRTGTYHLFCAEYCGTSHSLMRGRVIVQDADQYAQWLAQQSSEPLAQSGQYLFERLRCDTCHRTESTPRGPSLHGLVGRNVQLQDGSTVEADLSYIRRAILQPGDELVVGYENLMPSYQGQLSEEQILQLIAYLRTLSGQP